MTLGKNYPIRFTSGFDFDLLDAAIYYHTISPDLGLRFLETVRKAVSGLSLFWAREEYRENIRRLNIPKFPYSVYYTVDQDLGEIVVEAIRHNSMRNLPGQ